jgi:hypothetical protein
VASGAGADRAQLRRLLDSLAPGDVATEWRPSPGLTGSSNPVKTHPHAEATYRIVPLKDGAFGVEVVIPETSPTTVTKFATESEAEAWIRRHKSQVQSDALSGPRFRRTRGGA